MSQFQAMQPEGEPPRVLGTRELLEVIYRSITRGRGRPIQVMVRYDPIEYLQLELTRRRDFQPNLTQAVMNVLDAQMVTRQEMLDLDVVTVLHLANRLPPAKQEQLPPWLRQMMNEVSQK